MELHSFLWLFVAIISLFPAIVFWKGYLKMRTRNFLFSAIAFSLFFVKAVTLAMKIVMEGEGLLSGYSDELWWSVAALIDIIIIGLIATSLTGKAEDERETNNETKTESRD